MNCSSSAAMFISTTVYKVQCFLYLLKKGSVFIQSINNNKNYTTVNWFEEYLKWIVPPNNDPKILAHSFLEQDLALWFI